MTRTIANGVPDLHEAAENLSYWVRDVLWDEVRNTDSGWAMILDVGSLWRVDWDEIAKLFRDD